jgi:hypothetical protein
VTLGLRGDGRVEVLEGVTPGDRLIPVALASVMSGERVRAVAAAAGGGK